MITKEVLHRSAAAKHTHYYGDQADDYYSRDGQAAIWQGKGAHMLGASGVVDTQRFHAMLRGEFGHGVNAGSSIRHDSQARSGLDLTISAPKSVSLQALIGGDERIILAHDRAVERALAYAEQHFAQSRQTICGKSHVENTGNLIISKFRHETARATDNSPPDPQLHTHAVIMNLTQRKDGSWAALNNDLLVQSRPLLDSIYMAELAKELTAIGYDLRFEKSHIELEHISRDQIEHFSKRSAQMHQRLADAGLDGHAASHAQRQMAVLATRKAKTQEFTRDQLQADWSAQAKGIGIDFQSNLHASKERAKDLASLNRHSPEPEARQRIADTAMIWAIKHLSERETVMSQSALLSHALLHGEGAVSAEQLRQSLNRLVEQNKLVARAFHYRSSSDHEAKPRTRQAWAQELVQLRGIAIEQALQQVDQAIDVGRLTPTEPLFATQTALRSERDIVSMMHAGRGKVAPVLARDHLHAELTDTTLTPGQRSAIELMLSGQDQVVGVQGLAGTGKSYALQETKALLEARGYRMIALAPYGAQVANLRQDGIEANTVASMTTATETERLDSKLGEKTVVVIDEAGVIPVREMQKLLHRLQPSGARIVLLGDTGQTKAVEAGRAFALLQEQGMKTALMGDIQRQKSDTLKQAVELAAVGKASASLKVLEDHVVQIDDRITKMDDGTQIRDSSPRYEAIAREYVNLSDSAQANTLIVTGTNLSRQALNRRVHELKGLSGKGRQYRLLSRHDTTRAERRCVKYYTVGDIVQPERDYKNGMKRGQLYEVVECNRSTDRLIVLPLRPDPGQEAQPIEVIPKTMSTLSVYHQHTAEVSVGDMVRVTRNNAELDLANGERYEVLGIAQDSVTIAANGRAVTLSADQPLHLDHAYATTAHSAQGLTCDRVLYNAESFSRTTAQDTYYVSISRERHEVTVFTDNATLLPKAVNRKAYKGLAHDLLAPRNKAKSHTLDHTKPEKQHAELEI